MEAGEEESAGEGAAEVGEPVEGVESLATGHELLVEFVECSREGEGDYGAEEETESVCAERAFEGSGQGTGSAGEKNEVKKFVLMGNECGHVLGRRGAGEEQQDREPHGEEGPEQRRARQDRGERAAEEFHERSG